MVTGELPEEVSVSCWDAVVLMFTFPKSTLDALALSAAPAVPSCNATDSETPPALAVRVAVCGLLTESTVAVKLALVEPAATITVAGTATALLLLARTTVTPPFPAAALIVTPQLAVAGPVNESLAQLNPLRAAVFVAAPVPLRLTANAPKLEELLEMVSCPIAAPSTVGEKA